MIRSGVAEYKKPFGKPGSSAPTAEYQHTRADRFSVSSRHPPQRRGFIPTSCLHACVDAF
jgi:hypothetical protein